MFSTKPGPFAPFLFSACIVLVFLTLFRTGLSLYYADHLASGGDYVTILLQGLRVDAASISRLYVLPLLLWLVAQFLPAPLRRAVAFACVTWLTLACVLFVFFEVITPSFLHEYGTRPERKFFEYLTSPRETFGMLWLSFRLEVVSAVTAVVASVWLFVRWHARWFAEAPAFSAKRTLLITPLVLVMLFAAARSTVDGKPLHPGQVAFTNDIVANNLPLNSLFSASYAAYRMLEEVQPAALYGNMPERDIRAIVDPDRQRAANYSMTVTAPPHPKHIVVILEESLGARFVKSLGGRDIAPNLDALAAEGWWFERMYATGTRSVRGIEAVLSGFLPTPGRAIVRLVDSQTSFFTLATLLDEAGYRSGFYYGGRSDFDNMRGFTLSNGFHYVFDQDDIVDGRFRSTYGYCDDDIFAAIDNTLAQATSPQFMVVLTTSNHQPFEFPVTPQEHYETPLNSRDNAARYADAALGRFIRHAQSAPYWEDTIVLVVADHDARVSDFLMEKRATAISDGNGTFPVEGFHIPALFVGGAITPRRSGFIASQIDLPVTILGLAGITGPHPMVGIDLTTVGEDYAGRAIMQFADQHAHLEGKRLTVLRPSRSPLSGDYDGKSLRWDGNGIPADAGPRVLAHALWPSMVYLKDEYRMKTDRNTSGG